VIGVITYPEGKRYYSLKQFLKQKFGEKVYKIAVDAGFSCPNRDGTIGTQGCIFCSPRGSGDFAGACTESITSQIMNSNKGAKDLASKHKITKFIAYFQAFTNTYANIDVLREKYYESLSVPSIVGLAIATRPDCLDEQVLDLLNELNKKTYLWLELGLQTIHKQTAGLIRRGYPLSCFDEAVSNLNQHRIDTVCHLILGLPGESKEDMLASTKYIAQTNIQGIKLHLLHIIEGTYLADMYLRGEFKLLTKEEYVSLVVDCLELLPPNVVIHRITGDGPKDTLIGPEWSKNKRDVLNSIEKELIVRDSWQGKFFR
jgi:hypothetical protein